MYRAAEVYPVSSRPSRDPNSRCAYILAEPTNVPDAQVLDNLLNFFDEQQLATLKLALSKQEPTLIRRERQSGLRMNRLRELANRLHPAGCEIEVFHDCRRAQIYEICPVHSEPKLHFTFRG